jgi:hypothetical protein
MGHVKAVLEHQRFDRRANVSEMISGYHLRNGSVQSLFGDLNQLLRHGVISPTPTVKAESPTKP